MTLKFGKYAGQDLRDVPEDYIQWLIGNRKQELADYEAELTRRAAQADAELPMVEKLVQAGFRFLAQKLHPDHGGSQDEFLALQAAKEWLSEVVKKAY